MDDLAALLLDAARPRPRPPGASLSAARAWPQHAALPPRAPVPPRPASQPADARRGLRASGMRDEEAAGEDKRRGGVAEREAMATGAGAAGRDAAAIADDGALRVAASVVPRDKQGGSEAAGNKRWLAPSVNPPPKRRAVSARRGFPPGCGRDAAVPLGRAADGTRSVAARADGDSRASDKATAPPPLAASKDGVLLGAVSAASVLNKVSPADGAPSTPTPDNSVHGSGQGVLKSSAALVPNCLSASDGLLDTSSQGKLLLPAARLPPRPRMVYANRRFPPGCGRIAPSLIASGGSNRVRLLLEAQPAADGFGLWKIVAADGGVSAVTRDAMEIVAPPCSGTTDGQVQDDELEEGEVDTRVQPVVLESRQSHQDAINLALHESADTRHGVSVLPTDQEDEDSVNHSNNQKIIGGKMQRRENKPSWVAAEDVKVANKSGGSSGNVVAKSSVPEGPLEEDLGDKRVSEIAKMDRTSSGTAKGVSSECAMMRSKVMFTPRKAVKPAKVIQVSAMDTQHRPFRKDKDEEIESGRRVITNGIEHTDELTADLVLQAFMSSYKSGMAQEMEDGTSRAYFGPKKRVKIKDPARLRMKVASSSNLRDDDILKALAVHEGKLELYLNSSSRVPSCSSSVSCHGQHGVQNADARRKFMMTCKRFLFICRTIVQAVEKHSLKVRRIDLAADKLIRNLPGFTKQGPIVGEVPGVEVGDEFLYRVQLAIVGLHRPYQGGIDTTRDKNDMLIAISVVASGGYPDELSHSGELIYTGSGGKPARSKVDEDQKLEGGNLGLRNCIKTKSPVRVIHGFKGQNREECSHSRAKQISTFTYDGLYHVVHCWREGRPGSKVFKYKLQKIPGQPELPHCKKTGITR
ncbi:hypothetical protein ACP70R_047507 [Stipagrostis hirtigluma subsp. patula]